MDRSVSLPRYALHTMQGHGTKAILYIVYSFWLIFYRMHRPIPIKDFPQIVQNCIVDLKNSESIYL